MGEAVVDDAGPTMRRSRQARLRRCSAVSRRQCVFGGIVALALNGVSFAEFKGPILGLIGPQWRRHGPRCSIA